MNDIIKSIEDAQLTQEITPFRVGDTVKVYARIRGVGVERTWPVHSPRIEKIEVVRRGKVRRAKLNYLRQRSGKSAKVKEYIR